jgi:hypothetical protein
LAALVAVYVRYDIRVRRNALSASKDRQDQPSQLDKFKEAAREHKADSSVRRWNERFKKVAKVKPEKPE